MKQCLAFLIFMFFAVLATGQTANPDYDPELAKKLGSDDYGMKSYVLVILKTGDNKTTDKKIIDSCFRGHFNNIERLVEAGKFVIAANELLQTDPAIKENLLDADLYEWYGSAALPEYLGTSDKIWKVKP